MRKFLHFSAVLTFTCFLAAPGAQAQMVGADAYIKATSLEVGIDGSGGFEGVDTTVSPPLAGMHPRSGSNYFGFVANPQLNGWATFNGDFFTPGSPENGWGFEVGISGGARGSNNRAIGFGASPDSIPGAITSWMQFFSCYSATWEGDATSGTDLHFKINYLLQQTDLYYTTTVSVTNNTSANIPDFYYYRNVDPDNNEPISFDFVTNNTVVSEPGTGCDIAHVKAEQSSPYPSYLGFAGIGPNFRVGHGGFSNRDASSMYYGTGFVQTVGTSTSADEAIYIAYRIQNLAPGATETFKYVVILDDASATAAINNLLYFNYPGSASAPPAACTPYTDTVRTCGGPVPISVSGSIASDFNWSWSPGTGLSSTTGPSVIANPGGVMTYTVSGTPINPCVAPTTMTIVVLPTPGGGNNPYITPVAPICQFSPAFNLTVDSAGGFWSGTNITNATNGTFNPTAAGTFTITYTTTNTCNPSDTVMITVNPASDPTIAPHASVCAGSAPFNFTAATAGGTWSGTGITSPSAGTFNPSTAGTYTITYNLSGPCPTQDTATIVVNSVTAPVTAFTYTSPVCKNSTTPNPTPNPAPGFTTGGTWSSSAGLVINSSTGIVNLAASTPGTYYINYFVAATGCGPAGNSTDTLIITPLSIPVTTFSYPPVCYNVDTVAPNIGGSFTPGGVFTASGGITVDSTTGVVTLNGVAPGAYTVTYSVTGDPVLCKASGSGNATLTVNPLPSITMGPDVTMWLGAQGIISASGGTSYTWTPVTDLNCANSACDTAFVIPSETTTYCVHVTDNNGCIDSACLRVNIEIPCLANRNPNMPNAFSPNGDGNNDEFCLAGWDECVSQFQIMIYDRWGEKVYESNNPSFCWNGVYKGKLLDPGVYVYFITATFRVSGESVYDPEKLVDVKRQGNISLVR